MSNETQFTPDGVVIFRPMIGPFDRHPVGSFEWAEAVSDHVQFNYKKLKQEGRPHRLVEILREAMENEPHPWEMFPIEANGNPEAWMRLITGVSWSEIEAEVKRRDPEAWPAIAEKQAVWEAEHRTHGRPAKETVSVTDSFRDNESARGIRRRLQKRANDGDEQARELLSQLAAGDISINQAALAAGMRQEYIRVRKDNPNKAAASVINRMGEEWAASLAAALTEALCK